MQEKATPAAANPARPDRVETLVEAERTRALYDRTATAQATVVVNSAIVVAVLWGVAAPASLLAWAGAIWAVGAARLALGLRFRRAAPPAEEAARWARWFTAGAGLNGLLWGTAPLLLGAGARLAHVLFLAFVLGGMAAGAALSSASRPSAFLAFTVPALSPMMALLLAGGDRIRVAMGVLLAAFGAAVTAISWSGGRALAEAVRLRFANAELARGLAGLNAQLEARVAERTAQLEEAAAREREVEQELATAVRLARIGTLAAGVAHEINNPLTYVRSNLGYVREELAPPGAQATQAIREALAEAAEGVERVRGIVRHLMALSRVGTPRELQAVDVNATLDRCADMLRHELPPTARLLRDYQRIPPVLGTRGSVMQVFLNLLLNAEQAIPAGDAAHHEVRVATRSAPDGAHVVVEISDDGCGIPEADLERIWDPFFTTKPMEQGTGLGLSICRSIVSGLGGTIAVRSREGAGTTFTVTLRAAAAPPPRAG